MLWPPLVLRGHVAPDMRYPNRMKTEHASFLIPILFILRVFYIMFLGPIPSPVLHPPTCSMPSIVQSS